LPISRRRDFLTSEYDLEPDLSKYFLPMAKIIGIIVVFASVLGGYVLSRPDPAL
jgi:hypothetical protein